MKTCCEWFAKAQTPKTDSEGYEALLQEMREGHPGPEGYQFDEVPGVYIGMHLPPIKFCPWCAAPIGKTL